MKQTRNRIGVFCSRVFEENNLTFFHEIQKKCEQEQYRLILFSLDTSDEGKTESLLADLELCSLAQYLSLSAIVIMGEALKNVELIDRLVLIAQKKGIPCFCMDRFREGCYHLEHDYESGFEPMVRHVVEEHGVRRVNMLAGFQNHELSQRRIEAYKKVLQENGIAFEEERLGYGEFWNRPARREMKRFLTSDLPMPEAIVCANDAMAIVACEELAKAGYRVPEDVIVTGFDGVCDGQYYNPVLSTCMPDNSGAVDFIFRETKKFLETGVLQPVSYDILYKIDKNQSCGCQPPGIHERNDVIRAQSAQLGDCAWHAIAMNELVTSVLPLQSVRDVAAVLPDTVRKWCEHFRYACVKEELMDGAEAKETFRTLTTIVRGREGSFDIPGDTFPVEKWEEHLGLSENDEEVLVLRVLHAGDSVFGYTVEGFEQTSQRHMQRCSEFSMFLSNCINMVAKNQTLHSLQQHLLEANEELAALSEQDAMTGVLNRRGFYAGYNERYAATKKKYVALVSLDMNRLKYINDTYGHAQGDFAICALANAAQALCREDDLCARFGGDEFDCVLFTDDKEELTRERLAERLQRCLDETPGMAKKPYKVTASVGVVVAKRSDGVSIEQMIREADNLMYDNKKQMKQQRAAENA